MSEQLRLFIAVLLPRDVRQMIVAATSKYRTIGTNVRWVHEDNLHLTLKFIGGVPAEAVDQVADALNQVAKRHGPFSTTVLGVGGFPNARRARVVWTGISDGAEELQRLAEDVEDAMDGIGYPREGRFKPHITIGRLKIPKELGWLRKAADEEDRIIARTPVNQIHIMQSTLSPQGSRYTTLRSADLEGEDRDFKDEEDT